VVDAAVFEGRDRGVEAAAGAQVGGDSLLGWVGGVVDELRRAWWADWERMGAGMERGTCNHQKNNGFL